MQTIKTSTRATVMGQPAGSQVDHLFQIVPVLKKMPVREISDVLVGVDNAVLMRLFKEFTTEIQAAIFTHFNLVKQLSYFQFIPKQQFSELFDNMSSQQRHDWFTVLTEQEQIELLPYVVPRIGETLTAWSTYKSRKACKKGKLL
ncbi:magnesium transporter MgtE N-terminal domain-containing protein [Flavobacterium sp. JP2137]|uniref:magnesium transporter MgtE N-terminal domain-containing protein n=1 Tax=Flavobacterium sp. JP2137 TaxID=3414510 RepID=UPI003D2FBFE7